MFAYIPLHTVLLRTSLQSARVRISLRRLYSVRAVVCVHESTHQIPHHTQKPHMKYGAHCTFSGEEVELIKNLIG